MATLRNKFKGKNVVPDEPVTARNQPTAGELLRIARRQQGRGLDELFPELGLSKTSLQRLENNQFDLFPEGPYVRGYLKNYCAVLGIDPEPVLESYAHLSGEWDKRQAAVSKQASERQKRQTRLKGASVLLAIILALLVFWLVQPGEHGANMPAGSEQPSAMTEPAQNPQ